MNAVSVSKNPKIVVVGAGLAGLTTAYRLHESGFDVEVYEARNRVGGRVFTVQIGDSLVEMGALNIQDGGEAPNLLGLVDELGLETEKSTRNRIVHYFDGSEIQKNVDILARLPFSSTDVMAKLQEAARESSNMKDILDKLFRHDKLLYSIASVHLAGYEGSSPDQLSTSYISTLYHFLMGGLSSAHLESTEGENKIEFLYVKGGNCLLAEKLAENLKGRVHTNKPLRSIAKTDKGSYVMNFDGEEVAADIVVLAIPCGVFEDIQFNTDVLPTEKLTQIESIPRGTNSRIAIPISPKNDTAAYTNGRMVSFLNRDLKIVGCHYTQNYGLFTKDILQVVFKRDLKMLEMAYGFSSTQRPVVAKDQNFSHYDEPVGHCWPLDPYAKGSYSSVGAGQEEVFCKIEKYGDESVKTLFAPIDDALFFAGEHATIELDINGTMEAAVESGERTARMIKNKILPQSSQRTQRKA